MFAWQNKIFVQKILSTRRDSHHFPCLIILEPMIINFSAGIDLTLFRLTVSNSNSLLNESNAWDAWRW